MDKKKGKFISIVHTLIHIMAIRHPKFDIEDVANVLGKAYKVQEEDLITYKGALSDKALEFIEYQLHITDKKETSKHSN